MKPNQTKRNMITLTHVARRELGMDDDTYRQLLAGIPELKGETSTAALSITQLKLVIDKLKSKGFVIKSKKSAGKPHNMNAGPLRARMEKVEALLADMGLPWSYADNIANHMFGIKRCAWLRNSENLTALISALSVEQKKRSHLESIKGLCLEVGMTIDEVEQKLKLCPTWKRRQKSLQKVLDYLTVKSCEMPQ